MSDKRAICLNCIDGRVQLPVIHWIKDNFCVDYVDLITEPGMDGLLSDSNNSIKDICKKTRLSIDKNASEIIFIVGHHDCKGNPVSDDIHQKHIQTAVDRLKEEFSDIMIVGLWVNKEWVAKSL